MKIIPIYYKHFTHRQQLSLDPNVACIGLFDGVHKGHLKLINETMVLSKKNNLKAAVFTLSQAVPDYYRGVNYFIFEQTQKKAIFKKLNFNYYFNYHINMNTTGISKIDFMNLLKNDLNVKKVVVGCDFRFAHKAAGTVQDLINFFGSENVILIKTVVCEHGHKLSSNYIREILKTGDIKTANKILITPIAHAGMVVPGRRIGRTINYPTANQKIKKPLLIPEGVYITKTKIRNKTYRSISCYWTRDRQLLLETYIFNFTGQLYWKKIKIIFLDFLRYNQKISSLQELKCLINQDCQAALAFFEGN